MRSEDEIKKERFDKAFYGLLDAGNLIKLNKIRQCEVKSLLQEDNQ